MDFSSQILNFKLKTYLIFTYNTQHCLFGKREFQFKM